MEIVGRVALGEKEVQVSIAFFKGQVNDPLQRVKAAWLPSVAYRSSC